MSCVVSVAVTSCRAAERVDSTVAMQYTEIERVTMSHGVAQANDLAEEIASRRAGTPRDGEKLGLRIESVASQAKVQRGRTHRYRLPRGGNLGRSGDISSAFRVCHCLQHGSSLQFEPAPCSDKGRHRT